MNDKRIILPLADVFETENQYVITLDMPGTVKDSIQVVAENDKLVVTADTSFKKDNWKAIVTEFDLGSYRREFTIGNKVNRDNIVARYEAGILTVELEKSETVKPRKIEVKVA